MIIALLPSEIARLILNYLDEECFKQTYKAFLNECNYLAECKQYIDKGICLPKTIHGKTLKEYLITTISTTSTSVSESIPQLPKLKNSVATQTKPIETRSVGIEASVETNNEIYSSTFSNSQNKTTVRTPIVAYCTDGSTSDTVQQLDSLNESAYATNNKRKYEFKSPNKVMNCVSTINTTTNTNDSSKMDTNDNVYCYNQSNNSTPKKRRLLIGKNVNKVAELSISTIERQLEILSSTEIVTNESNQNNVANNNGTATPDTNSNSNNNNNNNSILVLSDNCNANAADESLYDLNNTTITNVLQNIENHQSYQTPIHVPNEDAYFENLLKLNVNPNSGVTPKLSQVNYGINNLPMYSTMSTMNNHQNNAVYTQNNENTNQTISLNQAKLQDNKVQSNSEIVITKVSKTQLPSTLQKFQEALQLKLGKNLSNGNTGGAIYLNPTLELSPNGMSYKLTAGAASNTFRVATVNNPQNDINYDIRSTSTSASSSPNSSNPIKKKRIYRRGPTIRKIIEDEKSNDETLQPVNLFQIDDNSKNVTIVTTIPQIIDSNNSKLSANDLSNSIFTPPSTQNDETQNEDSRESFGQNKSSNDVTIKTKNNRSNNSSFNDNDSSKTIQTRRTSKRSK